MYDVDVSLHLFQYLFLIILWYFYFYVPFERKQIENDEVRIAARWCDLGMENCENICCGLLILEGMAVIEYDIILFSE